MWHLKIIFVFFQDGNCDTDCLNDFLDFMEIDIFPDNPEEKVLQEPRSSVIFLNRIRPQFRLI
jgi:hypothetical protein